LCRSHGPEPACPRRGRALVNGGYIDFPIVRHLARGGMAEVYLARDLLLDRPVALKVLFPEFASDRSFVERFRREARAAANLNHPNIVSIYDRGEAEGTYYIAMEYIEGPTLKEEITSRAPLPEAEAVDVLIDEHDLRIDVFRSSGPGGQNVNKVATAVTLRHRPSGMSVTVQDSRSQMRNRQLARERLFEAITRRAAEERQAKRAAASKIRRRNSPRPARLKEKILETKRKRSRLKKLRANPVD